MIHRWPVHVYYEDTDLAGIVYYANYLKYIERGRSEFVRELGIDQVAMKRDDGIVFAVRRVEADYLSPGRFDEDLVVETKIESTTGVRMIFGQDVKRNGELLFSARVTVVSMTVEGAPVRLPRALVQKLH